MEQYAKDIKQNGFDPTKPVEYAIVNGKKILLDGHHRTEAAKEAMKDEIPGFETKVTPQFGVHMASEAARAAAERATTEKTANGK